MAGHSVDIPITNLDVDDDDFLNSADELDPSILQDDFEIGNQQSRGYSSNSTSFISRIRNTLSNWGSKTGYTNLPKAATNGIELREAYRDVDSFDLSDDEFLIKRQSTVLYHKTLRLIKKYTIGSIIIGLAVTVIILSAFLSKKNSSGSDHVPSKQILSNGTHTYYPTTILISLDGFHPHYISSELTPNLHSLLTTAYGAPYIIPSFPSSTFPNHWTLATGLYPQSHGIIGNTFWDPTLEKQFINVIPEKSLDPVFWGGEAIWSTAEKNDIRSAIHMFPGSEVVFPKWNPTEVDKYNGSETLQVKVDRINGWLDREISERPELIIGYVPTIDSLGHEYGIKGEELEQGLKYVDSFIGDLKKGISNRNLDDIVNLIIVSDHGMAPTSNDRLVYLDDLLNTTKIQHIDGWPLYGLRPYAEYTVKEVFAELKESFKENSGYSIYLREDLPAEFKLGGSRKKVGSDLFYDRVAPIWVVPDVGYAITTHDDMERKGNDYSPKGTHGYNNSEVLMRAIFLADGPFFRQRLSDENNKKIKPFHNVEVYNILCESLDITPALNNGTTNIFNVDNLLAKDWKDLESYPGVKFDIGGTIKADATYDSLYGGEQAKHTTTLEPSAGETAASKPDDTEAISDESGEEDEESQEEKEPAKPVTEAEKEKEYEEEEEEKEKADEEEEQKEKEAEAKEEEEEAKEDDHGMETDDKEDEDKPDNKDKGFIEEIEEDIEDMAEQFMDDVGELSEEIQDAVEDAFHKLLNDKEDDNDGDN